MKELTSQPNEFSVIPRGNWAETYGRVVLLGLGLALTIGLTLVGAPGLASVFFFGSLVFLGRPPDDPVVTRHRRLRAPTKPIFVLVEKLSPEMAVAELDGNRLLVLQLKSFWEKSKQKRWIESLAKDFGRKIRIMKTTGLPHAHDGEAPGNCENVVCIELQPHDNAHEWARTLVGLIEACGLESTSLSDAIFANAAGHGWWCSHFYCRKLEMTYPLAEQLRAMQDFGSIDHSMIITVSVDPKNCVDVSADLFMYTDFKPKRRLHSSPGMELLLVGKLTYLAAIVWRPLDFVHQFKWHDARLLTSADPPNPPSQLD